MATNRVPANRALRRSGRVVPSTTGWGMAGAVLCATALASSLLLPAPLVLLATGCVLATIGFTVAAGLLLTGYRMGRDGTVGWDMAAALVFFGFSAALLADTGAAFTALAELKAR
jgi:hypothetical protein